ncbi:MAG: hypothetical protein WA450_21415, partial [Candidatus Acidiferrales bacterium]
NALFNLARVGDNDLGSVGETFASRRAQVFAAGALFRVARFSRVGERARGSIRGSALGISLLRTDPVESLAIASGASHPFGERLDRKNQR